MVTPAAVQTARRNSQTIRPMSLNPLQQTSNLEPSGTDASAIESPTVNPPSFRNGRGYGRGGRRARGGTARAEGSRMHTHGATDDENGESGGPAIRSHISHNLNHHTSRLNTGRRFGGHLTATNGLGSSQPIISTLQANAPEFIPGQSQSSRPHISTRGKTAPHHTQRQPREKGSHPPQASGVKSTAPDIATRIHEDISHGVYECPICTSDVSRNSKIWCCRTCWTVFHLACIKKWSANEGSTLTQRNQEEDRPLPRQWRCPGCNLPKEILPSIYTCWCEKDADPRSISGIPPHSCGQTCGKERILPKKCPHPCELICHAGPCPPCTHIGPVQSCFCGKKSTSRRCVDTNYDTGWSCGEVCGDLMPCDTHTCQRVCHEGLCGACMVKSDCRCYCGKIEQQIICYERGDEKQSQRSVSGDKSPKVDSWTGMFDCGSKCRRNFDCGNHSCEKSCHPQDPIDAHCPHSPDVVSHCPCGKTSLSEISSDPRKSCQDIIPNCKKKCLKKLPCGHSCQQVCHSDACMPCLQTTTIGCRCGRVQAPTVCHQGSEQPPQCLRICKATLNCGRHECGERCCSGERKATERQAMKRKLRPLGASRLIDEGFEAEHICMRLCGRSLKCGNHSCQELCHKGPCGSCREAIFDEISCNCGKTTLQPPLPCGTISPPCRFDCERPKLCGHPRTTHNCHGDEENCPKCPFLAEKFCMCGKTKLKNQPCWLTDARCGEVCGKKLRCGSHFCRKPCHRPGDCEDSGKACQQMCGKVKKVCGHPCDDLCHAPSLCREDKPCQNKMLATCDCQHIKQETKCNASKTSEGNSKKTLDCDSECTRLERNRKLALALNIDPEAHKDDHIPYSNGTLQMFRESIKWAQSQEREFRVFAADESEKRLRFKPMPPHQRAFLHSLAEDFGFDSESMDPEPHRHIAIFKTPRFVMAPMKTLIECLRLRNATESAVTVIPETRKRTTSPNEPYNGFLLIHPRFGLTLEELRADFSSTLNTAAHLLFDISFLPSEEVVLKARPATSSTNIPSASIDAILKTLKAPLATITSSKRLANSLQLCTSDSSLNVSRREEDDSATNGGWSRVAAKGAVPRSAPKQMGVGGKSVYTVLGSKLKEAKKKRDQIQETKREDLVAEDWEEEFRREELAEEREKEGTGSAPGIDDVVKDENEIPGKLGTESTHEVHDVEAIATSSSP